MAATKNILAGSPSAADTLELGKSGGKIQTAAGSRFLKKSVGALTASSTDSQAAGTVLIHDWNLLTSGNDAHAVTLPVPNVGEEIVLQVTTGAYAVKVYPHVGGNINGGPDNAAIAVKEALPQVFRALSSTIWSWQGTVNT